MLLEGSISLSSASHASRLAINPVEPVEPVGWAGTEKKTYGYASESTSCHVLQQGEVWWEGFIAMSVATVVSIAHSKKRRRGRYGKHARKGYRERDTYS